MNDGVIELAKELVNKFLAALSLILHNCYIFSKLTDCSMSTNFKIFCLFSETLFFLIKNSILVVSFLSLGVITLVKKIKFLSNLNLDKMHSISKIIEVMPS